MAPTRDIPARTKKLIIQEASGICAFCGENNVSTLEFHHIHGKDGADPHRPENLIYVCKNCHGKITAGEISEADVVLRKRIITYEGNPNRSSATPSHVVNVIGSVNTGTIANEVHFHGKTARQPRISPPIGTTGADALKRNYLKHLIDRYHEFARAEKGESFRYQVFHQTIKRKYGAKWDMIPVHQFEDVCEYVQERIDKTALGRNRKSKGQKMLFVNRFDPYLQIKLTPLNSLS
jgi:hypothetical protein